MEGELWIWRPILAGKVALRDVKDGTVSIEDLDTLNGLLDMQADIDAAHYDAAKKKG